MSRARVAALVPLTLCLMFNGCGGKDGGTRTPDPPAVPRAIAILAPLPGTSANGQPRHGRALIKLVVDGNAEPRSRVLVGATGCGEGCAQSTQAAADGTWSTRIAFTVRENRPTVSVRASYLPASDAAQAARVDVRVRLPEDTVKRKPQGDNAPVVIDPAPTQPASDRGRSSTESEGSLSYPQGSGAKASMILVGDSLSEGQQSLLEQALPGWSVAVSAEIGRHLAEGMSILADANIPADGAVVAMGLFTNDDPWRTGELAAAVRTSLRRAGPNGCAIWATIASPPVEGQTFAAANRLLVSLAAREPRLRIVPWAAAAEQAGVLGGDGVHPNDAGARLRASLYARAAQSCV